MHPSTDTLPQLTLDARNRIASVNRAWVDATRCDGLRDQSLEVIDRTLADFVKGVQVRQLWEILLERVRAVGAPIFVPMRADTPGQRRVWDVEVHPLPERGVQLVAHCVWKEERPALALLDPAVPRGEESLPHCAWCNRIQIRIGAWEEVEDAQMTLRLDAAESLPALKQAVCDRCKQSLLKTFPARLA
ncbi:hypothetical protein [Povalibacter sp.]|uniref:hypothetical protein n=1 Tax=Povalibacter sp. TaxID=1962978 RepID=UPI002F3EDE67